MCDLKPQEIQRRVDAAKAKLPRLIAKVSSLPEAERKLLGHLPSAVKTSRDVAIVEELSERLGLDASTPTAKPAAPIPSRGAQVLEAITNPATNAAALAGVKASISAHEKLLASPEYQKLKPRQKLESLKAFKHDEILQSNAAHEKRCAKTRDQILSDMRDRMNGKK